MTYSERIGIAAHLHVALRRKAGRVTDTDWMASNDEYAREIVRFAREKSLETNDESLAELAHKLDAQLQAALTAKPPAQPLAQRISANLRTASPPVRAAPPSEPLEDEENRYIGGLR